MSETKFNSGEHVLLRLNDLWRKAHESVSENKYYRWEILLDRAWCELVNLMDEEELENYTPRFLEICTKIKETGPIIDNIDDLGRGFSKLDKERTATRNKQYSLLMEKEVLIRKVQVRVEKKVEISEKVEKEKWD